MTKGVIIDLGELQSLIAEIGSARRLVAIAGAPGSGKSTLTDSLVAHLNAPRPGIAAVLPMDGYHFDDRVLVPRGLLPRKGSPETFDVAGFRHMLKRLSEDDEEEVAVPVFDRRHAARADRSSSAEADGPPGGLRQIAQHPAARERKLQVKSVHPTHDGETGSGS